MVYSWRSWGSTLGLAYSENFNEYVQGLILRSVFLGTKYNINWAFEEAARYLGLNYGLNGRFIGYTRTEKTYKSYGKRLESRIRVYLIQLQHGHYMNLYYLN